MPTVRIVAVHVRNTFYVGDVVELEVLIRQGYKIQACAAMGEFLLYTLVMA